MIGLPKKPWYNILAGELFNHPCQPICKLQASNAKPFQEVVGVQAICNHSALPVPSPQVRYNLYFPIHEKTTCPNNYHHQHHHHLYNHNRHHLGTTTGWPTWIIRSNICLNSLWISSRPQLFWTILKKWFGKNVLTPDFGNVLMWGLERLSFDLEWTAW